jgi:HSP20 family protein
MTDRVCYDTPDTDTTLAPRESSPVARLMDGFWDYNLSSEFLPRFEMRESDDAITVIFEVPGVKKEDVHLDINNGVLRIKGERKAPDRKDEEECYCSELGYGSFERSFRLPDSVDEGKVKAKHADGLLELTFPKREDRKRKSIEIKVE